jgi:hypothetical protein
MRIRIWLLLSLLSVGITWLYNVRILQPWEHYVDVENGNLKAQMGDLYPRWVGTRELLLHHQNPYGPEVSHEIQRAFYGHEVHQNYASGAKVLDEQRFAYPVYVVFLLAPAIFASFHTVQVWVAPILAFMTMASVLFWIDLLGWRPPKALITAIVLFVLSSPQVVQGLRLLQLGLFVGFMLAICAWCAKQNHLILAGVFLALSTIKPQMILFPLIWFLLWSASAIHKRWRFLVSFMVTLALLVGCGEAILPQWPIFFWNGLIAYRKYNIMPSLLGLFLGNTAGAITSGLVMIGMLGLMWRNRQSAAGSPAFHQALAASVLGALLVLPLFPPFNQVLLLLPAMMILRDYATLPRSARWLLAIVFAWPWTTRLILLLVHPRVDSVSRLPLLPASIVVLVPLLLTVCFVIRELGTHTTQMMMAPLGSRFIE